MARSKVITSVAVALLGIIAVLPLYPHVRYWYFTWNTDLQQIPLAGAVISYRDFGKGSPAAVILSGVAVPKDSYLDLQRRISSVTRVISYDRPGIGLSTPNDDPRTLEIIDRDLKALLVALDVPPPYVMIGHSFGGFIARSYAARHPGEVAGLVFIDQPHEDWFRYIRRTWPAEEAERYFRWWTAENKNYSGAALEEILSYDANSRAIRGLALPPDIPVLMFTTSNPGHFRKSNGIEEDRKNWVDMQTSLLAGVKDYRHLIDTSLTHWPHHDKPEWVAQEIAAFIEKVRLQIPRAANLTQR